MPEALFKQSKRFLDMFMSFHDIAQTFLDIPWTFHDNHPSFLDKILYPK